MQEQEYVADVAITPDGQVLALLNKTILSFPNLEALGGFIDRLKAKTDACIFKLKPIDDQTAKEIVSDAIGLMEEMAKALSDHQRLEVVVKGDDGREANEGQKDIDGHKQGKEPEGERIYMSNAQVVENVEGTTSNAIMDPLVEFLREAGLDFDQKDSMVRLPVTGKNGKWMFFGHALEGSEQLMLYSICPVNALEPKSSEMAEYITRANYGLFIGNFEMDYGDGEVRYKTSIDVEGDRLVPNQVKQLVYQNFSTMDRYLPGIMKVLYSDVSPADAIQEVEGQQNPTDDC